ncbi:MAG TPA: M1 family metallopeptidase [Kofleriaceae bacterium]|jgi:alanyl aminopeptidase
MRRLSLLIAIALAACPASTPPPQPPTPVVVAPAPAPVPPPTDDVPKLRLPRTFLPTSYTARLAIDPDKPTFDGAIQIDGKLAEATSTIWLHGYHLTIKSAKATQNGAPIAITATQRGEELLEIHADAPMQPGAIQLAFEYAGQIDPVVTLGAFKEVADKNSYVFTQFESIGARRVFPCFDEPDPKTPWTLTLDVPSADIAVANTLTDRDSDLGNGMHRYEFATTKPLPSYLVAFGIGPFDVVPAGKTKSNVPVRIIVPKGHAAEAAYAAQNTARILDLLEEWFGIPYAFGKLDALAIPTTSGFGAMENAGLVTFQSNLLLIEPQKPSWLHRLQYIGVASHEFAHQWFGDLVTTSWWDDIWLNEGFANWMETKITAKFEPSWHFELYEAEMRHQAQRADSLVTARKIRQSIETEDDILNSFDDITYDKGASVLRMFEWFVGPAVFQRGVRDYLTAKQFGNATSTDFIAAIGNAAKRDVAPAFATFLDQPGLPQLTFDLQCTGGKPRVQIAQSRYVGDMPPPTATKPWIVPVCMTYDGGKAPACTLVDQPTATLELDGQCPRWVAPNAGGHGYYRVDLTVKQATALRDEAWSSLTQAERIVVFGDVVTSATEAHHGQMLPLALAMSFVPKMLASGEHFAIGDVAQLADTVRGFVDNDQRGKLEAWERSTFGPGATKVGMLPKDGDDLDTELARETLVEQAAYVGRDPDLVKQAVDLAAHWRDLAEATRQLVLRIAVDASPEVQAAVRETAKTEKDNTRLGVELNALAGVRDPQRLEQALDAMLDPAIDFRHSMWMLARGDDVSTLPTRQKFFKAHQAELLKRLPAIDDTGTSIYAFATTFSRDCDAARRDELANFIKDSFAKIPGAPRLIVQLTESLDRCIATRKLLEPEVRGWLGGVKIIKPAKSVKSQKTAK